ncbi:MAG: peptidase MA family metallohydrolase [Peptococcia bacterium]|jgi:hypothetical protein
MFTQIISLKLKIVVFVLIFVLFVSWLLPNFLVVWKEITHKLFQQGMWLVLKHQTKTYETLTSTNFILKYTKEDQDLASSVLQLAEDYLFRIEKILGIKQQKHLIPLVLYGDEETLNKSFGWSGDKSAVGVYWAGTIRLVSPRAWSEKTSDLWETFEQEGPLAHELTHLFIDEATRGNYPRWLTEGVAQYVEEEITGFTLSEPLEESKTVLYPFSSLENDFDQQPDQFLAYWQSLQAVRNLLEKYGLERLTALLAELRQGENFKNAFAHSYGLDFTDFEQEFKESGLK